MKSYTDLEQSRKLAEILPLESADMSYAFNFNSGIYEISTTSYKSWVVPKYAQPDNGFGQIIPCWSLATLIDILPQPLFTDDGDEYELVISKEENGNYILLYRDMMFKIKILNDLFADCEHLVDVCVEIIIKLKERNLL